MSDANRLPSQALLREWFDYGAETGIFSWKKEPAVSGGRPLFGEIAGSLRENGCIRIQFQGRARYAHRLAWMFVHGDIADGLQIDHIDGDRSNNLISNLRLATATQQKQNARGRARCGLKGAHAVSGCSTWKSSIQVDGKNIYLGSFRTAQEAHETYSAASQKYFGEFARSA